LVLSDVNLHINKGDFIWLIGQTGSGKSSLLKIIYGELGIPSGEGTACGYELKGIKSKDIPFLRRKLGIVFQDFQLLDRPYRGAKPAVCNARHRLDG